MKIFIKNTMIFNPNTTHKKIIMEGVVVHNSKYGSHVGSTGKNDIRLANILTTHSIDGQKSVGGYGLKKNSCSTYNNICDPNRYDLSLYKFVNIIKSSGLVDPLYKLYLDDEMDLFRLMDLNAGSVQDYYDEKKRYTQIFIKGNFYRNYIQYIKDRQDYENNMFLEKAEIIKEAQEEIIRDEKLKNRSGKRN